MNVYRCDVITFAPSWQASQKYPGTPTKAITFSSEVHCFNTTTGEPAPMDSIGVNSLLLLNNSVVASTTGSSEGQPSAVAKSILDPCANGDYAVQTVATIEFPEGTSPPEGHISRVFGERDFNFCNTIVPPVMGLSDKDAPGRMINAGLGPDVLVMQDSDEAAGTVLNQIPAAGVSVPFETGYTLYESNGNTSMPFVLGLLEADAVNAIQRRGLVMHETHTTSCGDPGDVIMQDPLATVRAVQGEVVTIGVCDPTSGGVGGSSGGSVGGGSSGGQASSGSSSGDPILPK